MIKAGFTAYLSETVLPKSPEKNERRPLRANDIPPLLKVLGNDGAAVRLFFCCGALKHQPQRTLRVQVNAPRFGRNVENMLREEAAG